MRRVSMFLTLLIAGSVLAHLAAPAEGAEAFDEQLAARVVRSYARGAYARYAAIAESVTEMRRAIGSFLADPTAETHARAKEAWIASRKVYAPSEAYRFYDGPIDNAIDGPEGLINAWPLDEVYVDYVRGAPDAGIINDAKTFPELSSYLLLELNEKGGEENVATGYHAVEFLLWGQDFNPGGPGQRTHEDYLVGGPAPNPRRRARYLSLIAELLERNVGRLVAAWDPEAEHNYAARFIAAEPAESIRKIMTGIAMMAGDELAGERTAVAYETRDAEDEQSCFSDTTLADHLGALEGIAAIYLGDTSDGTGITDLAREADAELDEAVRRGLHISLGAIRAIPAPFDQAIEGDDDAPGRRAVLAAIEALEALTQAFSRVAESFGMTLNIGA